MFREVTPLLKEGEQELAAQANWMEFASWQALAEKKKEPRYAASAVAALESLKRDFPASEQAGKADIYIARIQQDVVPEKAIESLSRVKPGEASYLSAQYEIVSLRHRIWKESGGDRAAGEKPAIEVLAAVDRFLSAAGTASRADERLRACLIAVEVLSAQGESEQGEIGRYLKKGEAAAAGLASTSPLLPEFHYRRLQHAQRTKDEAALRDAAEWLAASGVGTPYELPALVIVARHADSAVDAASGSDKQARQEEAAAIYRRLVALVGDSPETIAGTKNALAASSRLAGYDETLGRWKEAAARLDKIVAAYPSDKKYLRRAGIAHVNAGNHAAAVEHWRKLLAGLSAGSDEWLEAKHYQLTCLLATDRATAQKVWKQFQLLYPEVKSAAWKEKFAALERRFVVK
jgi:tetratricopeptide (TPR) repeat protein